ncbi:hypothetical protein LU631_19420 [Erwinia tracheiphila]|uniref:Uncharacterized protein n=2 Tax=Erwinia tracheiphila TaxID=65700 RepID=A0A0M2KDA2_9GAMM|nr:hypothetical protein [Erwinia tracheiphila]KKF35302.1 hypothetical protein SY86_07510 [Erwinia tracheiphila]UIA86964.1 hypothetical protein LU631_19420 [Erwinia tracheiphila]UIA95321.1 hypothetical protein LU633_17875 [Erwinia tracheiphila]
MYNSLEDKHEKPEDLEIGMRKKSLTMLLTNFHIFLIQMERKYNNRPGLIVKDEADFQDILYSFLLVFFPDTKREYFSNETLGSNSRIDFFIQEINTALELKHVTAKKNAKSGDLTEQILIDINRYQKNNNVRKIIFFIYDPEKVILNYRKETSELIENAKTEVMIIFTPTL